MRICLSLLALLSLFNEALPVRTATLRQDAAKNIQQSPPAAATPLNNGAVLALIKEQLTPEIIIAKIKSSACQFDTSPAALQQLKTDGVPDAVILAMVLAPQISPTQTSLTPPHDSAAAAASAAQSLTLQLPAGTFIDIEASHTISSQAVRKGDLISFRVINPVWVNGIIVIEQGATATAIVTQASRGGHFGRAGRLAWQAQEVTAVDGTRIPLQFAGRTVGDSKGAKVATQTVIMGALLGPAAPLALLSGFKRGENAYMPEGQRFVVATQRESVIKAAAPQRK